MKKATPKRGKSGEHLLDIMRAKRHGLGTLGRCFFRDVVIGHKNCSTCRKNRLAARSAYRLLYPSLMPTEVNVPRDATSSRTSVV
jgi:hypothetical protein